MKFKWDKKYLYWGITALAVVVCSIIFFLLLNKWGSFVSVFKLIISVLTPFIFGVLIAYILDGLLKIFEKHFFLPLGKKIWKTQTRYATRFSRIVSIITVQLFAWGIVAGVLALIAPQVYASIENLVLKMPEYVNEVISWLQRMLEDNPELESIAVNLLGNVSDYFTDWIKTSVLSNMESLITNITSGVFSLVKGLMNLLIGIVISIYIMYQKETFISQAKRILYSLFPPKRANFIKNEANYIHRTFGKFISGQLLDSVIVGAITYIVLAIIGMPYTSLISLIVGVTNMIPVFGPFIGAIPSALLILMESPILCLIFVIFILVLQQFDGNVLAPRIIGSMTGLSGFWVMFSILFFGGIFGFVGMFFGVPTFAVIYHALSRLNERRLASQGLPISTDDFRDVDYIDPNTNEPVYRPGSRNAETAEHHSAAERKHKGAPRKETESETGDPPGEEENDRRHDSPAEDGEGDNE